MSGAGNFPWYLHQCRYAEKHILSPETTVRTYCRLEVSVQLHVHGYRVSLVVVKLWGTARHDDVSVVIREVKELVHHVRAGLYS